MSKFKGKPSVSTLTVEDVLQHGITDFEIEERGIEASTIKHFGLRKMFNQVDGRVEGYFFPVTAKGKTTGFIHCNPNRSKKDGRFTVVGDVTVNHELLGQAQAQTGNKVFIVEGFWDILSAFQCLNKHKPAGFTGIPAVVSPALGIGKPGAKNNAKMHVASNIDFIDQYQDKVLCFDNDDASDVNTGQEAVKDMAIVLRTFKNVVLPVNDCNDMMLENGEKELYFALLKAPKYEHGSVVGGLPSELVAEEIMTPVKKGVMVGCLPETMRMLRGIRERELTVVLAPPKSGKTTLCKFINYDLIKNGVPTMGIYLEEDINKTRQSMVAMHCGVHLPKFREDPSIADPAKVKEAFELLKSDHVMFFSDVQGRMTPQSVMSQLEWAAIRGVKVVLLDHISFIFSGDKGSGNERKEIDVLMTDLASFVKRTGVHLIVVAHVARDKNRPKPKNSDGTIKYPYWYEVEETDARGSGAFEQVCWNMIGIDKQVLESKERGLARVRVMLNREWDYTGFGDTWTLDMHTGGLKVITEDY
jgi:hypothetical protein